MRNILILAVVGLAACARSEPVDEDFGEDIAVDSNLLAEELAADGEDARTGEWLPGAEGAAQSVAFQAPNGEMLFSIQCDQRGGLLIQRPGQVSRGTLALMQLRTGDTVRRLAVTAASGAQPMVQASVPYNDQLLQALMTFDEPLEVRYEGLDTIILPPSPLVGDLVRTCQRGVGTELQGLAAGNAAAPAPAPAQQPQRNAAEALPQPAD